MHCKPFLSQICFWKVTNTFLTKDKVGVDELFKRTQKAVVCVLFEIKGQLTLIKIFNLIHLTNLHILSQTMFQLAMCLKMQQFDNAVYVYGNVIM